MRTSFEVKIEKKYHSVQSCGSKPNQTSEINSFKKNVLVPAKNPAKISELKSPLNASIAKSFLVNPSLEMP